MLDRMKSLTHNSGADHLEIRWFEGSSSRITYRKTDLQDSSSAFDAGGNVRAFSGGGVGFATFTHPDDMEKAVKDAVSLAKTLGNAGMKVAESEAHQGEFTVVFDEDPRKVPLQEKLSIMKGYASKALDVDKRIISVNISYIEEITKRFYADSLGAAISQERVKCAVFANATAREGDKVRAQHETVLSTEGFKKCRNLDELMRQAGLKAVAQLEANPVKAGVYPVVLNPRLTGTFIHEAFGHLCEADRVYRNPDFLKVMTMGRQFGRPVLNVSDGGGYDGRYGSFQFDDEGIKSSITPLIKEGRLSGRLHSRVTSGIMGETPTGNGRCQSWQFPPIPRMTNTQIDPGDSSFEELISDIELGVYACGSNGGQTLGEIFTFSAQSGQMIRKGKLAEKVSNIVISGNLFTTLMAIDRIGNDFEVNIGHCGKGEQFPLPVTMSSPSIRILNAVVGGQ